MEERGCNSAWKHQDREILKLKASMRAKDGLHRGREKLVLLPGSARFTAQPCSLSISLIPSLQNQGHNMPFFPTLV